MNILIIGTGVIGSVYGWQLAKAGHAVTHFVRREKVGPLTRSGLPIRCLDMRTGTRLELEEVYRPQITGEIPGSGVDLVIVPVKVQQLSAVLPLLAELSRSADIFILQNVWTTQLEEIGRILDPAHVVYGQPHIMGGGADASGISCTLFDRKHAPTMVGAKSGKSTPGTVKVCEVLTQAGMNPLFSKKILSWLLTHYVEAAGLLAGVMQAGSAAKYAEGREFLRESVLLTREGYRVCRKLGINVFLVFPQCLYYFPMGMIVDALQKMFRTEASQLMINGHISHSPDEMKQMYYDVLELGGKLGIDMKHFRRNKVHVDRFRAV